MSTEIYSSYSDRRILINHASRRGESINNHTEHSHDVFEIIFFKRGNVTYSTGGLSFKLRENDLVISRPYLKHRMVIEGDEEYERYNILFDEDIFNFDFSARLPHNTHVMSFDKNRTVKELFSKLDFYASSLLGEELSLAILSVIREIGINVLLCAREREPFVQLGENKVLASALEIINRDPTAIGSVDDVCKRLYITKSHLHHIFSRELGITPKKYITDKKLFIAKREIKLGEKPTLVYIKCGFSDYSSFFRAYKRKFGISPSCKDAPKRDALTLEGTIVKNLKEGATVQ